MFQSRIRKASEQARPVRISGVALTSVSRDDADAAERGARGCGTNERIGSPPTSADDQPAEDEARRRARRASAARDSQRGASVRGSRRSVIGARSRRSRPSRRSSAAPARAAGHQQPDLVDVRRRRPRTSPTIRPSYMTSTRSDRARISSRSSEISRIAVARRAPLEQQPVDRLDRADVEAARRLDGDHQARPGLDLAGEDQPLEVAARQEAGLACRSTARRSRYSSLRPWASARAAASSMNQPRATGGVAVALHDQVVGDRQVRRAADPGPVLRDVGDARGGSRGRPGDWRPPRR